MPPPLTFVLDQDFPDPPLQYIRIPNLTLVPLREKHPDLIKEVEDWQVMRELKVRGGVDGWITLDSKMLIQKEMVILHQTRLSLVVFQDVHNDPLIATGLLMLHLPFIAKQTDRAQQQLWVLKRPRDESADPWAVIDEIAKREGISAAELYEREKLPFQDLQSR